MDPRLLGPIIRRRDKSRYRAGIRVKGLGFRVQVKDAAVMVSHTAR